MSGIHKEMQLKYYVSGVDMEMELWRLQQPPELTVVKLQQPLPLGVLCQNSTLHFPVSNWLKLHYISGLHQLSTLPVITFSDSFFPLFRNKLTLHQLTRRPNR
jgi:hypothetical protein